MPQTGSKPTSSSAHSTTSTCTMPSCPTVTQPAAASGVDAETCAPPVPAFCTGNEAFCDDFESYTSTSSLLSVWAVAQDFTPSDFDFHEGPECYNGGKCLRFNACNSAGDAFTQQTFSGSRTLTFMSHGAVLYGAADGYPDGHNWSYKQLFVADVMSDVLPCCFRPQS